MAYSYLLDLYRILDVRKSEISDQHPQKPTNQELVDHQQGQLDAITEFESFLRENFHSKLPRRIQNK
jgi:hypothetical protein